MVRVCESESIHLPSVHLSTCHAVSNIRSDAGEWGGVGGGGGGGCCDGAPSTVHSSFNYSGL